jgi:hypothetical protein
MQAPGRDPHEGSAALTLAGAGSVPDFVSCSTSYRPPGPADDDADVVPHFARGQPHHLDQLPGEDGEVDPQDLPQQRLAADVVAEAVRADQQQAP